MNRGTSGESSGSSASLLCLTSAQLMQCCLMFWCPQFKRDAAELKEHANSDNAGGRASQSEPPGEQPLEFICGKPKGLQFVNTYLEN